MIKRNLFILVSFLLTTNLIAQKQTSYIEFTNMLDSLLTHTVKEVLPDEIKNPASFIFLDAREKEEFEISHIPNALQIGYENFDPKVLESIQKNQPIIVYCSLGYRSEKVAEKLLKMGYSNTTNLYGGIFEWVHCDQLILNDSSATDKVHTYNKEWSKWLKKGEKVY